MKTSTALVVSLCLLGFTNIVKTEDLLIEDLTKKDIDNDQDKTLKEIV